MAFCLQDSLDYAGKIEICFQSDSLEWEIYVLEFQGLGLPWCKRCGRFLWSGVDLCRKKEARIHLSHCILCVNCDSAGEIRNLLLTREKKSHNLYFNHFSGLIWSFARPVAFPYSSKAWRIGSWILDWCSKRPLQHSCLTPQAWTRVFECILWSLHGGFQPCHFHFSSWFMTSVESSLWGPCHQAAGSKGKLTTKKPLLISWPWQLFLILTIVKLF